MTREDLSALAKHTIDTLVPEAPMARLARAFLEADAERERLQSWREGTLAERDAALDVADKRLAERDAALAALKQQEADASAARAEVERLKSEGAGVLQIRVWELEAALKATFKSEHEYIGRQIADIAALKVKAMNLRAELSALRAELEKAPVVYGAFHRPKREQEWTTYSIERDTHRARLVRIEKLSGDEGAR